MMEFYDSLFRFWAVGLFVLLGAFILRDYGLRLAAITGAISSFSGAGYLLISQLGGFENWGWGFYLLAPIGAAAPASAWIFSLSQFRDNFRIGPIHMAVVILYAVTWYVGFGSVIRPDAVEIMSVEFAGSAFRILLLAHMVYVAWHGRADDLVEARRKFRTMVVVLTTSFTAGVVIVETGFQEMRLMPEVALFQAFAFLLFAVALVWAGLRSAEGILIVPETGNRTNLSKAPKIDDATERHDMGKITKLVVEGQLYLETNLTIASLAGTLQMPEHRLRRLINQHLGYRNFADFLNHYRVEAAKLLLADPERQRTQVLVIAMDLGYGSLGPFNRAFKERTGQTPTEFRKQALARAE